MFDSHSVQNAIQQFKPSASEPQAKQGSQNSSDLPGVPIEVLAECLHNVNSDYKGCIDPEEEAQEGILNLASCPELLAREVEKPEGCEPNSSMLQNWANELAKTCKAFQAHAGCFFPDYIGFDREMWRRISLVHFLDESADGESVKANGYESDHDDATDMPNGPDDGQDLPHVSSFLQFVHWDYPEPPDMIGRRLRVEANRFVWKPPARELRDDSLGLLFREGKARVILATCLNIIMAGQGKIVLKLTLRKTLL